MVKLAKPYTVTNRDGDFFIAYNDREWRKVFDNLPIIFESEDSFNDWTDKDIKPKPHFDTKPNIIEFALEDLKAVLVAKTSEVKRVKSMQMIRFGKKAVKGALQSGALHIVLTKTPDSIIFFKSACQYRLTSMGPMSVLMEPEQFYFIVKSIFRFQPPL